MIRIGHGYDVHRFAEGRKLILGGVEIPHKEGLLGHSDADVLLHAVCDALLGAAGLGDIGRHFPDTDMSIKGISSMLITEKVVEKIEEKLLTHNDIKEIEENLPPHVHQIPFMFFHYANILFKKGFEEKAEKYKNLAFEIAEKYNLEFYKKYFS